LCDQLQAVAQPVSARILTWTRQEARGLCPHHKTAPSLNQRSCWKSSITLSPVRTVVTAASPLPIHREQCSCAVAKTGRVEKAMLRTHQAVSARAGRFLPGQNIHHLVFCSLLLGTMPHSSSSVQSGQQAWPMGLMVSASSAPHQSFSPKSPTLESRPYLWHPIGWKILSAPCTF
jgi:hypothetical protein